MLQEGREKLTELITFTLKFLINKGNFCHLQRTLSSKGESCLHSPPPTHKATYAHTQVYVFIRTARGHKHNMMLWKSELKNGKVFAMWLKTLPGNRKAISN